MNVGSILGGAFSLIRERPGAVAVWGLIYLVTDIVLGLGTSALLGSGINMVGTWSLILLLNFVLFLVVMVLFTAIQRAVLRPGELGFASLRFGMDEVRAILLMIFYVVLFYIGLIFLGVVMFLFVGATASTGSVATVWFMVVLQFIVLLCILAWFYVKLSLSFPLTLLRRRFVMGEAWSLSRGRFWTLFGAYFTIFAITFVLSLLIGLLTEQEYFSAVFQSGFNSDSAQQASMRQFDRLGSGGIDAMTMLNWVLGAALGTISLTLLGGATATAARELSGDMEGLTDTFS